MRNKGPWAAYNAAYAILLCVSARCLCIYNYVFPLRLIPKFNTINKRWP